MSSWPGSCSLVLLFSLLRLLLYCRLSNRPVLYRPLFLYRSIEPSSPDPSTVPMSAEPSNSVPSTIQFSQSSKTDPSTVKPSNSDLSTAVSDVPSDDEAAILSSDSSVASSSLASFRFFASAVPNVPPVTVSPSVADFKKLVSLVLTKVKLRAGPSQVRVLAVSLCKSHKLIWIVWCQLCLKSVLVLNEMFVPLCLNVSLNF